MLWLKARSLMELGMITATRKAFAFAPNPRDKTRILIIIIIIIFFLHFIILSSYLFILEYRKTFFF